jgi:hypothetical protein
LLAVAAVQVEQVAVAVQVDTGLLLEHPAAIQVQNLHLL